MQEEVTQKTVTFCIRTTKVTADLLKKVLAAYLRHQKQKSVEKKAKKNQPKPSGIGWCITGTNTPDVLQAPALQEALLYPS